MASPVAWLLPVEEGFTGTFCSSVITESVETEKLLIKLRVQVSKGLSNEKLFIFLNLT